MKQRDYYRDLLLWVTVLFVFKLADVQASAPTSINQLLDQAEMASVDVRKALTEFEVTKEGITEASMIPNPELTLGQWSGRAGGKKWGQTDVTLLQPIELAGKRGKRIDRANAQVKGMKAQIDQVVAEVRLQTLSLLYRLRQVNDELEFLAEAQTTFSRLVSNYRKRPQLSPEQSTSLFLFDLAVKDYDLQKQEFIREVKLIGAELKQRTGFEIADVTHLLPPRKKIWPKNLSGQQLESPYLRVLRAQTEASEMDLKLARADAWPTLNIGPSYSAQDQFGEKANVWGIVLSFPLPVLNQNDGAKALASTGLAASKRRFEIEKTSQENYRQAHLDSYLSSIAVLEAQASDGNMHKKHEEIESFFLRGLISSPLVIEAHRQMFENKKLYHERELETLEAYYQIVLLDGGKVEEL